jgi:glycosidase
MNPFPLKLAAALALAAVSFTATAQTPMPLANRFDQALAGTFEAREQDWRNGAIVYQVLVDRFAPSANLDAKRHLYPAPKTLRRWDETPKNGQFVANANVWSHEIDFWGGDLASLSGKLDYVQQLGADVLYLNPIQLATTNHKYDALDYLQISPEYGTRDDLRALATNVHQRRMKLVLDGVFNHMGRNSPIFQQAEKDPASKYRDWFFFDNKLSTGVRVWANAKNLPEINLDLPAVQQYVYAGKDSAVRSYLRDGIDGWRLDVAHDIGFRPLQAITEASHDEKPGSLVVGELWNYPQEWFPSVDGVMNFTLREIILRSAQQRIAPATASAMIARVVADAGVDNLLKSWLMLDNHDTDRLASSLPNPAQRHLAQVLQFTLPGAPNLYYGSELGMTGAGDPGMRAPMRWDLAVESNPELKWTRQLIALRQQHRALRVGNYRPISSEKLIAFERFTDRAADTVMVLVNPGSEPVNDTVMVANSKMMNYAPFHNLLQPGGPVPTMLASLMEVHLPAQGVLVLAPNVDPKDGYTVYKRVQ